MNGRELHTKVPNTQFEYAKNEIRKNQRAIVIVTESDSYSVINGAYRSLYETYGLIKQLRNLQLLSNEDYEYYMEQQEALQNKLNCVSANRKARQWIGKSRRAVN